MPKKSGGHLKKLDASKGNPPLYWIGSKRFKEKAIQRVRGIEENEE